jgi:hypothetical protein
MPAPTPLRIGRAALGLAMRAVPRRHRFAAAVGAAAMAAPVVRRFGVYRAWRVFRVESAHEIVLARVLNALDRIGVEFDPTLRVDGHEHLVAAAGRGRGVLLIGPHTMLTTLLVRHIHDLELPKTVMALNAWWRISGTPLSVPTIRPSATALISARARLAQGHIVCAMIDKKRGTGRTLEFDTAEGPMLIDDSLIRVAVRSGAQVLFTAARVENGSVVQRIAVPGAGPSPTAAEVTREFIAFVQGHVRAAAGTPPPADDVRAAGPALARGLV